MDKGSIVKVVGDIRPLGTKRLERPKIERQFIISWDRLRGYRIKQEEEDVYLWRRLWEGRERINAFIKFWNAYITYVQVWGTDAEQMAYEGICSTVEKLRRNLYKQRCGNAMFQNRR